MTPGQLVLLDDGRLRLKVEKVGADFAETTVITGGILSERKGVNLPGAILPLSALTEKDLRDLDFALSLGADWIALSFVQRPDDVAELRKLVGNRAAIMSKIEKPQALDRLSEIVDLSDGVMVARGDLGVELPPEDVPSLQKQIVRACRKSGKPVVVATQMLESMVRDPAPTRAEASDVANAVFDGTSAVMLSAETAVGRYPVECVEMMSRIAERADDAFDFARWAETVAHLRKHAVQAPREAITDAMTMAACRVAGELGAAAIVCVSGSGYTVRATARFRPESPILGLSADPRTVRQLTLSWGVRPLLIDSEWSYEYRVAGAIAAARGKGLVRDGDLVVALAGIRSDSRATDVLRCLRVGTEEPAHPPQPPS
jgi:pyruvate kinase